MQALGALLDFLGRHAARAVVVALFAGIALQPLAHVLKPWLPAMIFLFLVLGFTRLDMDAARRIVRAPGRVALNAAWIITALPLCLWCALSLIGRETLDPGFVLGLSLQSAAAPILSMPAIALMLGLDATFSLMALCAVMLVLPLSAPLIAGLVAGAAVPIDRLTLGGNLFVLLAGSALAAALIRRLWGVANIEANTRRLDGVNVLYLFAFAIAVMEGFPAHLIAEPGKVAAMTAAAFLIAVGALGVTYAALRRFGPGEALVTGFASGHRNAGLMIAALGGALPETTWLYFALVQFPIYFMPALIAPLARRITR